LPRSLLVKTYPIKSSGCASSYVPTAVMSIFILSPRVKETGCSGQKNVTLFGISGLCKGERNRRMALEVFDEQRIEELF